MKPEAEQIITIKSRVKLRYCPTSNGLIDSGLLLGCSVGEGVGCADGDRSTVSTLCVYSVPILLLFLKWVVKNPDFIAVFNWLINPVISLFSVVIVYCTITPVSTCFTDGCALGCEVGWPVGNLVANRPLNICPDGTVPGVKSPDGGVPGVKRPDCGDSGVTISSTLCLCNVVPFEAVIFNNCTAEEGTPVKEADTVDLNATMNATLLNCRTLIPEIFYGNEDTESKIRKWRYLIWCNLNMRSLTWIV